MYTSVVCVLCTVFSTRLVTAEKQACVLECLALTSLFWTADTARHSTTRHVCSSPLPLASPRVFRRLDSRPLLGIGSQPNRNRQRTPMLARRRDRP